MIALEKLDQFDSRTNFAAWMGRIVRYVALNHGRRKANAVAANADPQALEATPGRQDERDEMIIDGRGQLLNASDHFDDRVLAALRSLEGTARACLLLRTLLNMPYRDIALALDIAQGTAMSHVHRARTALRDRLNAGPLPKTGIAPGEHHANP
jgi:RNA polymerase sigma-70 factor (ECF subfamily)